MTMTLSRRAALMTGAVLMTGLLAGCGSMADDVGAELDPQVLAPGSSEQVSRADSLFTQGLQFSEDGASLYHSGGGYGDSRVVRMSPDGEVLASHELSKDVFAEGLTLIDDEVYVLTWKEHLVYVLDAVSLELQRTLELPGEGWGISWDAERELLWVSDGSAVIRAFDREMTPVVDEDIAVRLPSEEELTGLNELELIGGRLWANVWKSDLLVAIESDGSVVDMLDAGALVPEGTAHGEVTNGIARDPSSAEVWITGKRWDRYWVIDEELFSSQ